MMFYLSAYSDNSYTVCRSAFVLKNNNLGTVDIIIINNFQFFFFFFHFSDLGSLVELMDSMFP